MHRLTRSLAAAFAGTALLTVLCATPAAGRAAGPPQCSNWKKKCDVLVTKPPVQGGTTGPTKRPPGAKPSPGTDPTWDPEGCSVYRMEPQPPHSDPIWAGHLDGAIYLRGCNWWAPGFRQVVWRPAPPPRLTPQQLAERALATLTLPAPQLQTSPGGSSAGAVPSTWVNLWTWYWTAPGSWHPLSATAALDGVSATVTVTPKVLTFQPGQGAAGVTCAGPGRAWTAADGNSAPSGGGCGYMYRHTSTLVRPVVAIRWAVTWQGSDGTTGQLPQMTTQAATALRVEQIQVVDR